MVTSFFFHGTKKKEAEIWHTVHKELQTSWYLHFPFNLPAEGARDNRLVSLPKGPQKTHFISSKPWEQTNELVADQNPDLI